MKCTVFRRKEASGNQMKLNPVLKEIKKKKSLKERLILNGTKGLVISEQDPTHLSFQFVKRN